MLESLGIHPERLGLYWASAAEAPLFVDLVTKFTNKIEKLGPLGSQAGLSPEALKARLAAARAATMDVKLRTRVAKLTLEMRQAHDYSEKLLHARIAEKLEPVLKQTLAQKEVAST
jgi:hypothetical protein